MKNSIFNEKKSILKKRLKQPTLTHTYSQVADSQLLRKALKNQSYKADSFKDYPIRTHSLVRAKNAAHDPAQWLALEVGGREGLPQIHIYLETFLKTGILQV